MRLRDYVAAGAGALGISLAPIFVTLSEAGPVAAAFWRFAYALPLLAVFCALDPRARASFRQPGWMPLAVLSGFLFALDLLAWHAAIGFVGAGPATLLVSSQVIWVALFGAVFLHEHPSRLFWALLPVVGIGMFLLCGGSLGGFARAADRSGLLLGLLGGFFYAGMLVTLRRAQRAARIVPQATLAVQVAVGIVVVLVAGLAQGTLPVSLSGRQHAWLACLGVGTQVVAWFFITAGIRRIPGHHGSLVLLMQPAASLVLAWWLLGQALEAKRAFGAAMVLAAIAAVVLRERGGERLEQAKREA